MPFSQAHNSYKLPPFNVCTGIRTPKNLTVKSRLLYQLSYTDVMILLVSVHLRRLELP